MSSTPLFIDELTVTAHSGRGGDGIVTFRREKFIEFGGPYGGDGGNGGDIWAEATATHTTLVHLRGQKHYRAPAGVPGGNAKMTGADGEAYIIPVPVGTLVYDDETNELLADLDAPGSRVLLARGGRGGFGNAHFVSSVRQTPRVREIGEPGQKRTVRLQLKLLADVGLVGLPSAGKSSLIAAVSAARPKIADYPFTTLAPNLGIVRGADFGADEGASLVMADLPGLIAGASLGKGLGHQFLRHIERTAVLAHVVDGSRGTITEDVQTILTELHSYDARLLDKPMLLLLNKCDLLDDELIAAWTEEMLAAVKAMPWPVRLVDGKVHPIAAALRQGMRPVVFALLRAVGQVRAAEAAAAEATAAEAMVAATEASAEAGTTVPAEGFRVYRPLEEDAQRYTLEQDADGMWHIRGRRIEQIAVMTDYSLPEGVLRLYDVLEKMGIARDLLRKGVREGQPVRIGDKQIVFYAVATATTIADEDMTAPYKEYYLHQQQESDWSEEKI